MSRFGPVKLRRTTQPRTFARSRRSAGSRSAHNEVLRRYPERMQALTRGYFHERRGDHTPGEHPV